MSIFNYTVVFGEAGYSLGEHWDKVSFLLGGILPVTLLMLGFLCLGVWLAWNRYRDCFDRFEAARKDNEKLISELDEVVNDQKILLAEVNGDYRKNLGRLGRREESIKTLHLKLAGFEDGATDNKNQLESKDKELSKLNRDLSTAKELEGDLKNKDEELGKLKSLLTVQDDIAVKLAKLELESKKKSEEFDALKSINQHLKRENTQLKDDFKEATGLLADSGGKFSSFKEVLDSINSLSIRVPELEEVVDEKDSEIAELQNQLEDLDLKGNGETKSSKQESPSVIAMTLEETMGKFEGESVKADQRFGVVYTDKPDKVDDLKKIKGVGKVLENKLNEFGVYRYKQIALWTPPVVNEFVDSLPFGDRVTRDHWIDQASEFHESKYGESVAG